MITDSATATLVSASFGFIFATALHWLREGRLRELVARREAELINLSIRTGRTSGITYVTHDKQAAIADGDGGEYVRTVPEAEWQKLVKNSADYSALGRMAGAR